MGRSLKKQPFVDHDILKKIEKYAKDQRGRKPIQTFSRRSTILPEMVGYEFDVHNGKKFIRVLISESMVGHKLGEFSFTRNFKGHVKKAGK